MSSAEVKQNPKQQKWDPDLACLMNRLLDGAVKLKQAAEVGRRAVDYFRGPDFVRWILQDGESLKNLCPRVFEEGRAITEDDVQRIGDRLLRGGFIYRAQYKPITGTLDTNENGEVKRPKWPKRLAMVNRQVFDENAFYVVVYEGSKTWKYVMLGVIISAVLLLCMFPAWPLKLKIGVWYASVFFMTAILIIVVLRLFIFVFAWFFGVDFWFFPNLFDEEAGVFDSFVPFFSFERRSDDWIMFGARVFCAFLLAGAIYKLGETHSVSDVGIFAKQSLLDVLDWGHHKLAAVPENKPKYPSLNDIEETVREGNHEQEGDNTDNPPIEPDVMSSNSFTETEEDYSCLGKCGFVSYEQLMEGCLLDCSCMKELVNSSCFGVCSEEVQKSLNEALLDSCFEEEVVVDKKSEEL